jgi:hypothetical protein
LSTEIRCGVVNYSYPDRIFADTAGPEFFFKNSALKTSGGDWLHRGVGCYGGEVGNDSGAASVWID